MAVLTVTNLAMMMKVVVVMVMMVLMLPMAMVLTQRMVMTMVVLRMLRVVLKGILTMLMVSIVLTRDTTMEDDCGCDVGWQMSLDKTHCVKCGEGLKCVGHGEVVVKAG